MSTNGERFNKSHLARTCGALCLGQTFGQRGENDNFTHNPDFRENKDEIIIPAYGFCEECVVLVS